ncbi:MAG: ABC transporter substrate-binding protein, partial [candidate division NC10 bacterium]
MRRMVNRQRIVGLLVILSGILVFLGTSFVNAQEPVRIGYIYTSTGPFAQTGLDMRDGFKLYLSVVGSKAGGRAIDVIEESIGSNKPDEALTKARKLVERDKVHVLGGVNATPEAYALRPYVTDRTVPT